MIKVFVPGLPAPGGSKRAIVSATTGKAIALEDCKRTKSWRATVAQFVYREMVGRKPMSGPVSMTLHFRLPRPKGHFRTGRNANLLRDSAPLYPTVKPDTSKLCRSTEDALKGIAWIDDSQVVIQKAIKTYTLGTPGAEITIEEL